MFAADRHDLKKGVNYGVGHVRINIIVIVDSYHRRDASI